VAANDIERGSANGSIDQSGRQGRAGHRRVERPRQRFAQVLSQAGAKVVLASRRVERLKELRAEIEAEAAPPMCRST
jgi:hypothetical protein